MGLDSQGAQSTYVHGQMSCVHTSKKLEFDLGSCPRSLTDFPHLVGFYFYLKLAVLSVEPHMSRTVSTFPTSSQLESFGNYFERHV